MENWEDGKMGKRGKILLVTNCSSVAYMLINYKLQMTFQTFGMLEENSYLWPTQFHNNNQVN